MACEVWRHGFINDGSDDGLEAENALLKKMQIEENLKVEIVTEALAKKW